MALPISSDTVCSADTSATVLPITPRCRTLVLVLLEVFSHHRIYHHDFRKKKKTSGEGRGRPWSYSNVRVQPCWHWNRMTSVRRTGITIDFVKNNAEFPIYHTPRGKQKNDKSVAADAWISQKRWPRAIKYGQNFTEVTPSRPTHY